MISVIVPCFNAENHLQTCFRSLKKQTYQEFEIIFIDDGSTDQTPEMLEQIQKEHPEVRIQIHVQENQGVSAARNRGIQLAKGEYLTFVDMDDYLYPEFLETLYQGKERGDLSVVGIGGDGYGKTSKPFRGILTKDRFVYEFWLTRHLWGSVCNKLYAKHKILQNQITFDTELQIMEDMVFNMVYCRYIDTIYVSDQILYHYSRNNESTMHRKFSKKHMSVIHTFQKLMDLPFNRADRNIIELHRVNSLLWLLRTLYRDGSRQDIRQYETQIKMELSDSNQKLFFRQGWRKGFLRYTTFLLYAVHPLLYKHVIQLAYRFRGRMRRDCRSKQKEQGHP